MRRSRHGSPVAPSRTGRFVAAGKQVSGGNSRDTADYATEEHGSRAVEDFSKKERPEVMGEEGGRCLRLRGNRRGDGACMYGEKREVWHQTATIETKSVESTVFELEAREY